MHRRGVALPVHFSRGKDSDISGFISVKVGKIDLFARFKCGTNNATLFIKCSLSVELEKILIGFHDYVYERSNTLIEKKTYVCTYPLFDGVVSMFGRFTHNVQSLKF